METNYKIKHNKNWPVRYKSCVARPLFRLLFMVAEKRKNMVWTCEGS